MGDVLEGGNVIKVGPPKNGNRFGYGTGTYPSRNDSVISGNRDAADQILDVYACVPGRRGIP